MESCVSAGAPSARFPSPAAPWQALHCPRQIFALDEPESDTDMALELAEESVASPPQLIKSPSRAHSVARWRMGGRLLVEETT